MRKIRNVSSVVVGLAAALVIFFIGEQLNWLLHPIANSIDQSDREELRTHLNSQPISIWLVVLTVWSIGSLVAGYLIKYICKSNNYSLPLIAGCILTLLGTRNIFTLPHPVWFTLVAFLAFIPFVLMGFSLTKAQSRNRR